MSKAINIAFIPDQARESNVSLHLAAEDEATPVSATLSVQDKLCLLKEKLPKNGHRLSLDRPDIINMVYAVVTGDLDALDIITGLALGRGCEKADIGIITVDGTKGLIDAILESEPAQESAGANTDDKAPDTEPEPETLPNPGPATQPSVEQSGVRNKPQAPTSKIPPAAAE